MTECSQSQFPFEAHFSRQVVGRFDGSRLTTDGGALLLRLLLGGSGAPNSGSTLREVVQGDGFLKLHQGEQT